MQLGGAGAEAPSLQTLNGLSADLVLRLPATRQSTSASACEGITFVLLRCRGLVGTRVTPSIGSASRSRARRDRGEAARPPREPGPDRGPSGRSSSSVRGSDPLGGRLERRLVARALGSAGASFSSALSPIAGIEAWPGDAAGAQQEAVDALLADAERVEARPLELEGGAAALVDDHVAAHRSGCSAQSHAAPMLGAHLLVGRGDELSSPAAGASRRGPSEIAARDLGRDLALHVLGAAAADLAVDDVADPRGEAPLRRVGGDRVDVAEQAQGLARARRRVGARPGSGDPARRPAARTRSRRRPAGRRAAPAPAARCPAG